MLNKLPPMLQIQKLRYREVICEPNVSQIVSDRAVICVWLSGSSFDRLSRLLYGPSSHICPFKEYNKHSRTQINNCLVC